MCGIAGTFDLIKTPESHRFSTESILERLSQRGPDHQSFWSNHKNIMLFHSRLSILDIDIRSNQPFCDPSGRYVLVYNGEIYNFKDLRKQLNYSWQTQGDTEVLMQWLIHFGTTRLDQLDGMFAFAFWDCETEKLLLARDRMGKKPLYYNSSSNKLIFSSDIRVMLAMEPALSSTTLERISTWLFWQTIPGNHTILSNIMALAPGSFMEIDQHSHKTTSFCILEAPEIIRIDERDALVEIQRLMDSSIKKRLISDVPLACFLSGGIDSSIIAGVAQRHTDKLHTFNLSFEESDYSEHLIAREVANKFNTKHTELLLSPLDFLASIEDGLSSVDHPSGDGLNTYFLSKRVKEIGFKVGISGIGGDEWFLGYHYFNRIEFFKKMEGFKFLTKFKFITPSKLLKPFEIIEHVSLGAAVYPFQRIVFDSHTLSQVFSLPNPEFKPNQSIFPNNKSNQSIQEWLYYTQPVLVRDSDQMGLAAGLEIRAPFLDWDIVQFALSLPDQIKRGNQKKHLLIEAFKEILPERVYQRPKQGFTLPWEYWMRKELKEFCQFRIEQFSQRIDNPVILVEWQKFLEKKNTFSWSRWWSIVSLEDWLSRNNIHVSE
jgi:asparagine synthase (glutamine-hydrolysing)